MELSGSPSRPLYNVNRKGQKSSLYCEKCCPKNYHSKSWITLNDDISYYLSYLVFTDYQKMLQSQITSSSGMWNYGILLK